MSVAMVPVPLALDYASSSGASSECDVLLDEWRKAEEHYRYPVTRRPLSDAEKFYSLAEAWRQDVRVTSSLTEMILHPAYQRIIGMGIAAVPFILHELERKPDHWFWALTAITGADPVQPEDRGKLRKMAEAWLRWGREQGLTW
jgi:hypothetical protein